MDARNEKLRQARTEKGLSQSQLAAAAGINNRMLQYYEQGVKDVNGAKLSTLLKMCLAMGCRLEDVLTDQETLRLLEEYKKAV